LKQNNFRRALKRLRLLEESAAETGSPQQIADLPLMAQRFDAHKRSAHLQRPAADVQRPIRPIPLEVLPA
jgi:hypothetical protein